MQTTKTQLLLFRMKDRQDDVIVGYTINSRLRVRTCIVDDTILKCLISTASSLGAWPLIWPSPWWQPLSLSIVMSCQRTVTDPTPPSMPLASLADENWTEESGERIDRWQPVRQWDDDETMEKGDIVLHKTPDSWVLYDHQNNRRILN